MHSTFHLCLTWIILNFYCTLSLKPVPFHTSKPAVDFNLLTVECLGITKIQHSI